MRERLDPWRKTGRVHNNSPTPYLYDLMSSPRGTYFTTFLHRLQNYYALAVITLFYFSSDFTARPRALISLKQLSNIRQKSITHVLL